MPSMILVNQMIPKNFRKTLLRVEFLLGFLILAFLVFSPIAVRAFSVDDFVIIDFSPTITKIHSLQAKVESSLSSLTSSVLDAVREFITPESELTSTSLLNAYRDYVEEAPTSVKTVTVQGAQGIPGPPGPEGK